MKYKVASYINVYKNGEFHFLSSKFKEGKEFQINESIYNFILFFAEYKTFNDAIEYYQKLTNDKSDGLTSILNNFFISLRNEKVLIGEDENEVELKEKFTLQNGDCIQEYCIEENLSSSNHLEIYKVSDKNNKYFILKGYFKSKFTFEKNFYLFSQKLFKEFNILNELKNSNINTCTEILDTEDYYFIVLEFIDGKNIYNFIIENELSNNQVNDIINKVVSTFAFIHSRDVIHGDIHFGNILMNNMEPMIIDFGLSNNKNDEKFYNGGFPIFMPPERVKEEFLEKFERPSSFSSDVYQLGVLLYFILTKEIPFESKNWKELVKEKKEFVLQYSDKLKGYYPFIKKCLQINPLYRYTNAVDLKKDLENV